MKILDAVFHLDNKTVRVETDKGKFYLLDKVIYDVHPANCFAKSVDKPTTKEVIDSLKKTKYFNDTAVKELL